MLKHSVVAFAVAVFLSGSLPALAAEEISPAKIAIAKELIDVSGATQMAGTADVMADGISEQLKKSLPSIDNEAVETVRRIAHEEFEAARPAMLDQSAQIYARHFSESEMRDLITFYRSPTGQRMIAETPTIVRECMQMSSEVSTRVVKRFIAYMQQRDSKKDKPAQ